MRSWKRQQPARRGVRGHTASGELERVTGRGEGWGRKWRRRRGPGAGGRQDVSAFPRTLNFVQQVVEGGPWRGLQ